MTVARVTEITSQSATSFEDAIRQGIQRANETLRNVTGAWVKEQQIEVDAGKITGFRVNMLITFVLEDAPRSVGVSAKTKAKKVSTKPRGRK